jgi:hypothetical protein
MLQLGSSHSGCSAPFASARLLPFDCCPYRRPLRRTLGRGLLLQDWGWSCRRRVEAGVVARLPCARERFLSPIEPAISVALGRTIADSIADFASPQAERSGERWHERHRQLQGRDLGPPDWAHAAVTAGSGGTSVNPTKRPYSPLFSPGVLPVFGRMLRGKRISSFTFAGSRDAGAVPLGPKGAKGEGGKTKAASDGREVRRAGAATITSAARICLRPTPAPNARSQIT